MDAYIKTISEDSVEISWDGNPPPLEVSIFQGSSPELIDRSYPVVTVSERNFANISGLRREIRHYFYIAPQNANGLIVAERRVWLDGPVNFRDLGGYKTSDGRRIKWGKVFRADNLARLSAMDQTRLENMGIELICDFRTGAEIEKAPDKFPAGNASKYLHLPVIHGESDNTILFDRIKKGDVEWINIDLMIEGYIKSLENYADIWGEVIKHLANTKSFPMVFHCTAGKDRTGICAALILLVLGVPEQSVIEDHHLSNIFIAKVLDKIYTYIQSLGIPPERVSPYFTAPKECITSLIHHLNDNYGSAFNYFTKKAKIDPKILAVLEQNLLE